MQQNQISPNTLRKYRNELDVKLRKDKRKKLGKSQLTNSRQSITFAWNAADQFL